MTPEKKTKIVDRLLRVSVALAFVYPPISAFFNPYAWVGYFPPFLTSVSPIDSLVLLHIFGAFEIAIGVWILFGKRIFIPSGIAALSLFLIVVLNLAQMDVLFRDIPIMLMAIGLCILYRDTK